MHTAMLEAIFVSTKYTVIIRTQNFMLNYGYKLQFEFMTLAAN